MYKVVAMEDRKYTLYVISTGKTLIFNGLHDLINYIALSEVRKSRSIWNKPVQSILDNLNITGKDIQLIYDVWDFSSEESYSLRDFMVFNSEHAIVDIRNYKKLIEAEVKSIEAQGTRLYYAHNKYRHIRFRQDPVPYTSKRRRCACYRAIRTFNERKQNSAPEIVKFVRGARKEIPSSWDEITRNREKGWKYNSKRRSQYKTEFESYRAMGKQLVSREAEECLLEYDDA